MYYMSITETEDDIDNTVNKKPILSSDRPFFLFPNTRLTTNGKHVCITCWDEESDLQPTTILVRACFQLLIRTGTCHDGEHAFIVDMKN